MTEAYGSSRAEEAQDCFDRAVETATRQGARILLLRAQLARARSRSSSGSDPDAVKTLREVYSGFTEGTGTVDLLDAARFLGRALDAPT